MTQRKYREYRRSTVKVDLKTPDKKSVEITSGFSFGSGTHGTTRLSIRAMNEIFRAGKIETALDIGCGSGILAIAAAKLGARKVVALDIEFAVLTEAKENVRINEVNDRVRLIYGSLNGINLKFDIIVANIPLEETKKMAGAISDTLNQNGVLIVSGIPNSRLYVDEATEHLRNFGVVLEKEIKEKYWSCLSFVSEKPPQQKKYP